MKITRWPIRNSFKCSRCRVFNVTPLKNMGKN